MKWKLETAVRTFNSIVDGVESRCMAADGPVTPTLREMREDELRALWKSVQTIKSELPAILDKAWRYEELCK